MDELWAIEQHRCSTPAVRPERTHCRNGLVMIKEHSTSALCQRGDPPGGHQRFYSRDRYTGGLGNLTE